jgi:hypothetical protein
MAKKNAPSDFRFPERYRPECVFRVSKPRCFPSGAPRRTCCKDAALTALLWLPYARRNLRPLLVTDVRYHLPAGVQYDKVVCRYPNMAENKRTLAALVELANLHESPEATGKFSREHPCYTGAIAIKVASLWLQTIWHGGREASRIATTILSDQPASATIAASVQAAITAGAETSLPADAMLFLQPIRADWPRGELIYKGAPGLQQDLYELLKQSRLAKICARPDCPYTPYFIAKDARTRYCSTDCADAMQGQWRKDWWAKHGKRWRKSRKQQSNGKRER